MVGNYENIVTYTIENSIRTETLYEISYWPVLGPPIDYIGLTRYRNGGGEGFGKVYRMPGFIVAPGTRRENNTMYH